MQAIRESFRVTADAELTTEANPGTLSYEMAAALKKMGFNRLSMGVQAWQNSILHRLGRIHTIEEFLEKSGWRRDNPELCSECYLFENHICRKIQGKIWYFSRIQYENGLRGMKQGFN
jgi:hypothetical protein